MLALVAILGWAGLSVSEQDVTKVVEAVISEDSTQAVAEEAATKPSIKDDFNTAALITPERRDHILYGDASGGGHLFGQGKPCKTEFPKHWSEETIIKEVSLIAANDNLSWEQQRNGYYVTEQNVGTVRVRVVKDQKNERVITSYPVNLPRNPCPANDP